MTENRNADRLILDWLALEPGAMDAERVDASLATARARRQRHGLRAVLVGSGAWPAGPTLRLSKLPPGLRIAIALAAATAIAAGGLLAAGALLQGPADPPRALTDVSRTWLAREPDDMDFGFPSGPPSVLTLHLPSEGSRAMVTHLQIPNPLLASNFAASTDQIVSFTTIATVPEDRSHPLGDAVFVGDVQLENCLEGDVGRYRWSLTDDDLELTLTAITDACDSRRAVFERTWLRGFAGTSRGGPATVPGFRDMFSLTLPEGEYEVTRLHSAFVARGALASGEPFTMFVLEDPRDELEGNCREPWTPGDEVAPGRDSIQAFGRRRPMFVGALADPRDDRLIGGLTAMHVTFFRGCADGSTVLWGAGDAEGYRIGQPEEQDASLWFVELEGELLVFGMLVPDASESGELEATVLDTVRWIDR